MNQTKTARFSVAMFSTVLMLAFQLLSGSANAVNIPITTFSCSVNPTPTATSTCVSGFFSANWASGGYWQYDLNTIGFSGAITMTFKNTKSSAAGPTTGQIQYSLTGAPPYTNLSGGLFSVTTGCVQQSFTLPATCSGIATLSVRVVMSGATNGTATHRISAQSVFDAASAACSTTPAGGSVAAGSSPICGGSSSILTLTGATAGTGISRQWQDSISGGSWANIAGATGDSYTATPSVTTYYRVVTTCSGHGSSNSSVAVVVVNAVNIGSIVFDNDPIGPSQPAIIEAGVFGAFATYPGGIWASSAPNVASIDASGAVTPNFGGETVISYQAIDTTNGCLGTVTRPISLVWQNTLALYAGTGGNSTHVINIPGDETTDLVAVGFGSATQCGSGGLSGLTVPLADTAYDPTNPYVSYKVGADAGNLLNMYRLQVRLRSSNTGPTKARIAYDVHIPGSGWQGLAVEPNDHNLVVNGSCGVTNGATANIFDYNTGSTVNPNPTVLGADSIEVRVYPFKPGAATGTFQANVIEVYGILSNNAACGGFNVVTNTGDSVLPALSNICDSGFRFLNYNLGSGGLAGAGIAYQWQVSSDNGVNWSDIAFATGAVYQTDTFHAGVGSDTMMYRVKVTCSGNTGFSAPNLIAIHSKPTIPAFTGGVAATAQLPFRHMLIGTNYTLTPAVGFTGGKFTSNDTSSISIDSAGNAVPHLPGDAVITYSKSVNGCFGSVKDTVVAYYPNTKALYVGRSGNTVNVYAALNATASNLTTTNFGSTTPCQNGGVSGLTQTTTTQDVTTNGSVVTTVGSTSGNFNVSKIYATTRMSGSGTFQAYLAYKPTASSTWTFDPSPVAVETDDCGYSHGSISFNVSPVITVTPAASYDFAVFAYDGGSGSATFQVNAIDVIGTGNAINGLNNFANSGVKLFPNPVTNVLNVSANEKVTVAIYSIDGKKLIEVKDAGSIDVSSLVSGMYLVQVYGENNNLLKTDKFVKK